MKHEFWAEFDLYDKMRRQHIDAFVGCKESKLPNHWQSISDLAARQHILAQLLPTKHKNYARVGTNKQVSGLLFLYHGSSTAQEHNEEKEEVRGPFQGFLVNRLQQFVQPILWRKNATPPLPPLSPFPPGSWAIQVHFTLRKPYLSKDDVDFYIIDNPVKKEWVFKVPYVAPSQWKGALRAAMMRELRDDLRSGQKDEAEFIQERLHLYRLFGNEKDGIADFLNRALTLHRIGPRPEDEHQAREWEKKYKHTYEQVVREFEEKVRAAGYRKENVEGFRGRLYFYPTFFDRIGLEVINPHDRETGAGKNPIYFESVPAGTMGVFTLLYVPLDRVGRSTPEAIEQDLKAVARGVRAMLTEYGFGAKTSSGYGVVHVKEENIQVLPDKWSDAFIQEWKEGGNAQGTKEGVE